MGRSGGNAQVEAGSPDRFAYEWQRYAAILPESREQLERWLGSTPLASFAGKTVLDVGSGMGRNPYWIARAGAARVLATDVDGDTLAVAARNLRELSNAEVRQLNVYDLAPSVAGLFDQVTCIGVLHHLDDPAQALRAMWSCVAPGGSLELWCYGRPGNGLVVPVVQVVRVVTSRLPLRLTRAVSVGLARCSWPLVRRLPWRAPYYRNLRRLSYLNYESIVFDQLLPRISRYWSREEMAALIEPLGGGIVLELVQGNSWHARVTRPMAKREREEARP
jgi:SAM-dependent methyltransferase